MTIAVQSPPEDFDRFWQALLDELDALPIAPELSVSPLRTTEFATVYEVRLTSVGPYRIFAYYSVPRGQGPFPTLFHTPRYGSVVTVPPYEERQRYVVLALCHRGQRRADQPFAAAYPGLLTTGITAPNDYIYRGIVADCCRAVDFLLSRPEVDRERIAVIGNDLALITAALRPQIDAVVCVPELFYAAQTLVSGTDAYPLEEFNDYIRAYPDQAEAVWRTLNYFDPIHFAPRVRAATLLISGTARDLFSPEVVTPLAEALSGPVTRYETTHSTYRDGVYREAWLRRRYGFAESLLPAHWRQSLEDH